jgi:PAS domain S-box-containing protein
LACLSIDPGRTVPEIESTQANQFIRPQGVAMNLHPGLEKLRVAEGKFAGFDPIRRALHENEDWYQDLVEHSQDLLCIHDLEGRLLSVNPAPARLLGYSVEEILQIPMRELVAPEFRSQFDAYLEQIERVGEACGLLALMTRSGERRIWEYHNTLRREGMATPIVRGLAHDVTVQKFTEKLLREASELNRQIIASASEGVVVYDRDLRCLAWNTSMEKLTGIPASAALGKPYQELIPPEVKGHNPLAALNRALQGDTILVPDEELSIPGGHSRWISTRKCPLRNAQGEITGVIVTLQDITDRKRAEGRLQEYERVVEGLEEMIVVVDREYRYVIANRAFLKYRDMEREQILGHTVADVIGKRVFEMVIKEKMDECFRGRVVQYELEYEYPKLGNRDLFASYFPIEGAAGVERIAIVLQDVTQRKQAEEALRRSEENYRLFVSQSSEGIFREKMDPPVSVDLSEDELVHRILYESYIAECNDAMAAMYGLTSGEELRGKRWAELVPPEDPHNIELTRQYIRSGFRVLDHESREVDIYGNPKVFLNSMIGTVENGMLVRTWGIQRDITEKVKLEESRQKVEEALRRNVAQLEKVTEELRVAKDKLAEEKLYLEETIDTELGFGEIIGRSNALKEVMQKVGRVAPSDATVLLLGETGTGKELVARALHRMSRREGNSFIKLNCAAIPHGLLESELFGHEKGAFTGAVARKLGRLELADRGTLFLDEIGEIPLSLQPKLLRVLQDQEFERLGGTQTLKVNFRLLAATNRHLLQSVKTREFRSDLYYRLNVFPILIPPLRERREDIRPLAEHFVRKFSHQMKKSITSIPSRTMEMLVRWEWPGNIRELENFVERSVILTPGSVLQAPLSELQKAVDGSDGGGTVKLRDKERERILHVLRECHGKLGGPDGAAARLGLKRTTLQSKLDQLGIKPAAYRA